MAPCLPAAGPIASDLAEVARQNVARSGRFHRCGTTEIVVADATRYRIPDDVTVVHIYNPFDAGSVILCMQAILESLQRAPRRLTLLYANPYLLAPLAKTLPWLRPRCDVKYPFAEREQADRYRYRIYDAVFY